MKILNFTYLLEFGWGVDSFLLEFVISLDPLESTMIGCLCIQAKQLVFVNIPEGIVVGIYT